MERNKLGYGLLVAAVAPLVAFLLTEFTVLGERLANKPLLLYAFAGLINLWCVRFCYKKALTKTAAGIVAMTFAAALALIFLKRSISI